mgnify:CR=1 FL=1
MVLHLNKTESHSPKDALCKVCLKLAQWFWRRRFFLILSMYFRYFVIISPLEKGQGPSFEQNWIPFNQRCLVPSLVEISLVVQERKIFKFCQCIFCYFVIISPWKRAGLSFEQNWIPFTQGCLVPSLVENSLVVQEKKVFNFRQCIFAIS